MDRSSERNAAFLCGAAGAAMGGFGGSFVALFLARAAFPAATPAAPDWLIAAWLLLLIVLVLGLWPALDRGGPPTHALVTDIGNDIGYGATPAELAGWVEACLRRVAGRGVRPIVTLLPAASLGRLPRWQYHVFKTLLFPGRRLPFPVLQERLADANARLTELAARHGAVVVAPPAEWFRADAIHFAGPRRAAAWHTILGSWGTTPDAAGPLVCRGLAPAWRTVCGVSVRRAQPAVALPDGTTISVY